ncbi:hypothetical protein BJY01DRAFT_204839 [Aspergillus pseudoustus]|uniref:Thiaminase-2/PQQC domain-containing protein n=1 Tax=Aspergillus pseudoustus TaxID=1810923 RepID=A0ABR4KRB1_9EURO
MKLTTHLPTTTPSALQSATTHPFLRLAGAGRIHKPLLSQWLSQDRLYAQSYVRFIGALLAKIQLPRTPSDPSKPSAHEKILTVLVDAITNIQTELGFFESSAREFGLDLNAPSTEAGDEGKGKTFGAAPITQSYIDMFMSASSPGTSLLEGLVVLWATEVCYLRAWRFAASYREESTDASGRPKQTDGSEDADGGALRIRFIPNWSSLEFEAFVDRIGKVLDEFAEEELKKLGEDATARCERWWGQVVWLEERFWPNVGEYDS